MPVFINESLDADRGLICGFRVAGSGRPRELSADDIAAALAARDGIVWLHFNLSDARARRWLLQTEFLPPALRDVLQEHDENHRLEQLDDGLLLVMNDFTYEDESDPSESAPLWCFADRHVLITARLHPLKSSDDLRLQLRDASSTAGPIADSGIELMVRLLELRTARLRRLANAMTAQLDKIEDQILAGNIEQQREQLGRTRRVCARLRRQFTPERSDMSRFLHRLPGVVSEADREALQSCSDALGFAIEEISELYERAKLLQEELASRLAENTGRNLYVLSILTAVLLPMTLVTGIFGMNVDDLPGVHSPGWVMVLILVSGAVTLAALFWRKLL